ncbi:MAG: class I SAM-dependent RNA methyltransferase [Proteobacteria bacterium]|jgi:23S rRNA (uracil1939-C5)-methyltransferase|nr:MAG: class I SAM-dependent RNA methyltransferase [Pseudomonadota bacterium]
MADEVKDDIVRIARLGAQGDGIVETSKGPVYLPFALPGEQWRLGKVPERLTASDDRHQPICQHFGKCGGCVAQHMSPDLYRRWKEKALGEAFAHRGIEITPQPMRSVALHSRRRAFFGVARRGDEVVLGFRQEGRHVLVDLAECPVLDPLIVETLPLLRWLAGMALPDGAGGRLLVTRAQNGLDVAIENCAATLKPGMSEALARAVTQSPIRRLTVFGEVVFFDQLPTVLLGDVSVELPPGVFLQAVPEAEAIMADLVLQAVGKVKSAADLFSGLGTFTFPLACTARVLAVDSDRRSITALEKAARGSAGLKPITARVRDLMREPLSRLELEEFSAVVLDPPRAGAKAQAEMLAKSRVPTIVMVSCNPATAARDARTLIDGGYKLETVTPIDQFVYSAHLELVAVFRR